MREVLTENVTAQVIKALYDYTAPAEPNIYLSFSAGDFLHVISRENDADWYEACNPLKNERGLVPVKYFDEVGKTVRDSGDSSSSGVPTHDSGYAEARTGSMRSMGRTSAAVNGGGHDMSGVTSAPISAPTSAPVPGHRPSKSIGRSMGGVYGIVSYDFQAERPDELDAKEGEPIIVIAQSNPEWFVAKPITRLGGPGLIPVSFIEIRDMSTGKAVDDTAAAIAAAGIPKVEEWKKMAAEYKNTSIPLGTVSAGSMQEAQQGMDRMSVNGGPQQNGGYGHQRQLSNTSGYTYQQQQQQNLFAPERASVPRYIFADEKFHFIVECRLSNGSHWDLSRIYEDFYELQINLINAFPEEAGQVQGRQRVLPYMPGPVKFVTDNISEGRRANLDEYLRDLLRLKQEITCSSLVRNFFAPRQGDYEVDPSAVDLEEHARPHENHQQRYSNASQQSYNTQSNGYPAQQRQPGPQQHQYNPSQTSNGGYGGHQRQQSYASQQQQQPSGHYRSPSDYSQRPPQQYNPSTSQPHLQPTNPNASTTSIPSSHSNTHSNPASQNQSTAPVKVKAWFDRDTCVVLRMPPRGQFSFEQLYQKIAERRKLEFTTGAVEGEGDGEGALDIEYRDERDGEYYRLEGDDDLDIAVERNEKLTLAVRATGS